jgi:hypothetical protein
MLSPDEFRGKYPSDELESKFPDSPIGSLRDLQYLYGKLYTLATTGGRETLGLDVGIDCRTSLGFLNRQEENNG